MPHHGSHALGYIVLVALEQLAAEPHDKPHSFAPGADPRNRPIRNRYRSELCSELQLCILRTSSYDPSSGIRLWYLATIEAAIPQDIQIILDNTLLPTADSSAPSSPSPTLHHYYPVDMRDRYPRDLASAAPYHLYSCPYPDPCPCHDAVSSRHLPAAAAAVLAEAIPCGPSSTPSTRPSRASVARAGVVLHPHPSPASAGCADAVLDRRPCRVYACDNVSSPSREAMPPR